MAVPQSYLGETHYVNQLLQRIPYRPELGAMELKDWPERVAMNAKRYFNWRYQRCFTVRNHRLQAMRAAAEKKNSVQKPLLLPQPILPR